MTIEQRARQIAIQLAFLCSCTECLDDPNSEFMSVIIKALK